MVFQFDWSFSAVTRIPNSEELDTLLEGKLKTDNLYHVYTRPLDVPADGPPFILTNEERLETQRAIV